MPPDAESRPPPETETIPLMRRTGQALSGLAVVRRCMAKDPRRRYADAGELEGALAALR